MKENSASGRNTWLLQALREYNIIPEADYQLILTSRLRTSAERMAGAFAMLPGVRAIDAGDGSRSVTVIQYSEENSMMVGKRDRDRLVSGVNLRQPDTRHPVLRITSQEGDDSKIKYRVHFLLHERTDISRLLELRAVEILPDGIKMDALVDPVKAVSGVEKNGTVRRVRIGFEREAPRVIAVTAADGSYQHDVWVAPVTGVSIETQVFEPGGKESVISAIWDRETNLIVRLEKSRFGISVRRKETGYPLISDQFGQETGPGGLLDPLLRTFILGMSAVDPLFRKLRNSRG
jgi:hypothetical protein